ncbi:MAG TPA: nuclear transport factor 2 family protein [Bryobacteraceae bacterium]|jgi:ketosteroid isomerase-like protein
MIAKTPEEAVEIVDRAFNAGDIETILDFYEENAVVVTEPGKTARGKSELRSFFKRVLAANQSAHQIKTYVLESDGVALFLSRWRLVRFDAETNLQSMQFVATTVFRKQPSGEWKALIDNSFGPLVLGPD